MEKRFSLSGFRRAEFHVIVSIVLFVGALVAASILMGGHEVLRHVASIGIILFAVMLLLSLLNYLARAMRWQLFSKRLDMSIPFPRNLTYYFAGFAMTTTPGKLGEAARLWFMERAHGYKYTRIAPLFIGDRVSDLNAMVVLCVIGLSAFSGYEWAVAVLVAAGLAFTVLLVRPRLLLAMIGRVFLLLQRARPRLFARIRKSVRLTSRIFDAPTLLTATILSVCGWLAECYAFMLLLQALGTGIGFQAATFIFAFSMLAGAITMLPGGLGGVEGAMLGLLVIAGAPADIALVATIVIRITTLWFAVALGFLTFPIALRLARRPPVDVPA